MSTAHLHKGRMFRIGSGKFVCRLELDATTLLHTDSSSAKAVASRRGAGKSTRQIQTRMLSLQERVAAKHWRVVKVATEPNPAVMLTKALGRSKVEVNKLKKVTFAVEAMDIELNDAKMKNEPKDAKLRWMHTKD